MAKQERPQTYAEITPDIIQDWKAQTGYDELTVVNIKTKPAPPVPDGEPQPEKDLAKYARYVVIPPTRSVMDALGQHSINKNVAASNKLLIANCILGGDMAILEQDGTVYGLVLDAINKLGRDKVVELKNI
jgi:hypothetical protein